VLLGHESGGDGAGDEQARQSNTKKVGTVQSETSFNATGASNFLKNRVFAA
jgi:hypothetical protein